MFLRRKGVSNTATKRAVSWLADIKQTGCSFSHAIELCGTRRESIDAPLRTQSITSIGQFTYGMGPHALLSEKQADVVNKLLLGADSTRYINTFQ